MWALAIEDKRSGKVHVFESEDDVHRIDHDDPDFGDGHLVPIIQNGEYLTFGCHEFKRDCYCRPEIITGEGKRPLVYHKDRKPN
jgi:hypothetical protein